jgi:heat shock protein HtpX
VRQAPKATAQLWIESPLDREKGKKGSWLNRAFDTHPPLEERIKLLEAM